MIGALICTDKDGKKVNLASLSGTSRKFVSGSPTADSIPDSIQGFIPVPCIVPPEKIDAALEKNDAEIHRLTRVLEEETDAEKRNEILRERKKLTDESLAKVHALYSFRCIDALKNRLQKSAAKEESDCLQQEPVSAPKSNFSITHLKTDFNLSAWRKCTGENPRQKKSAEKSTLPVTKDAR